MNKTILLIAYSFPPENESGAARPFRFYRYLPEYGISATVVTATAQERMQPDVLYVRDVQRDLPRQTWAWHLERAARKLLFPGELGLAWSGQAAAHGCAHGADLRPSAVLSTSPPFSTHLAALRIGRRLQIPWIADFRDPMYSHAKGLASRVRVLPLIEAYFLARAHALIANTEGFAAELRARYPRHRDKIRVIWNGFDPADDLSPLPIPHGRRKELVHTGELYGGRHPGLILDSMLRLARSGVTLPGNLRLSLIGPWSDETPADSRALKQLIELDLVTHVPSRIPQSEARLAARRADALLLLQPHTGVQVPAKLFEYVRIGRPVLALVKRESPSERILLGSGVVYRAIYPDDPPEQVDRKMLEFMVLPNTPVRPSTWFNEQFDGRTQVRLLAKTINDACGDGEPEAQACPPFPPRA